MAPACRHVTDSAVVAAFRAATAGIAATTFRAAAAGITAAAFRAAAAGIATAAFRAAATMVAAATFRATAAMVTAATFGAAAAVIAAATFRASTTVIAARAFRAAAAVVAARAFRAVLAFAAIAALAFAISSFAFPVAASALGAIAATVDNDELAILADRNFDLSTPNIKLGLADLVAGNTRRRWNRQQGEHDSNRCRTWHPTHVFLPFTAGRFAGGLRGKGYDFPRILPKQIANSAIQKETIPANITMGGFLPRYRRNFAHQFRTRAYRPPSGQPPPQGKGGRPRIPVILWLQNLCRRALVAGPHHSGRPAHPPPPPTRPVRSSRHGRSPPRSLRHWSRW